MVLGSIWLILTDTILSSAPDYTIIGWPNWYGGLYSKLIFIVIFFLATIRFNDDKSDEDWSFLKLAFPFSILMALFMLLELVGFSPFVSLVAQLFGHNTAILSGGAPIVGVGNSGVLAGFWLILLPIPLIFIKSHPNLSNSWMIINSIGISLCHSKISSILTIIFLVLVILKSNNRKFAYVPLFIAAIFAISPITKYTNELNGILYERGIVSRSMSIKPEGSLNYAGSLNTRLIIFKATIDSWKARPLRGLGSETLHNDFFEHVPTNDYRFVASEIFSGNPDDIYVRYGNLHIHTDQNGSTQSKFFYIVKPHNIFLESLHSHGIIGLTFFLLSIVFVIKNRNCSLIAVNIFTASIVLYLTYASLWFTAISVTPLVLIFAGFIISSQKKWQISHDRIEI